mgnify:CR=1 FL=1
MKKWLARKLFDTAIWLDWEEATIVAEAITISRFMVALERLTAETKGKPGRPKGSKDKAPRKRRAKS